jgi:hypothetical protein
MNITYKIVIKSLSTTKTDNHEDVVSHIHFDYVGTNENNQSSFCQGVIPFQIHEHSFLSPAINEIVTIPSILNSDTFVEYNDVTEEMAIAWVNEHLPTSAITTYQEIISKKLNDSYEPKSFLPWQK